MADRTFVVEKWIFRPVMWGDRLKLKPEGARRRLDREGPRSKCAISALLFLLSSFSFLPSSPFPFPFKPPSLLSRPFTRPKIVSSFFPHFVPIHFPLSIPEPRARPTVCCPNIPALFTSSFLLALHYTRMVSFPWSFWGIWDVLLKNIGGQSKAFYFTALLLCLSFKMINGQTWVHFVDIPLHFVSSRGS